MEIENRKLFMVVYKSGVKEYMAAKDYREAIKVIRYINTIPDDVPNVFESEIDEIRYLGLAVVPINEKE